MARDKAYPPHPITVIFKANKRSNKWRTKTFKTKNIDEIIDGLEAGTLIGIPKTPLIKHIGVGSVFI